MARGGVGWWKMSRKRGMSQRFAARSLTLGKLSERRENEMLSWYYRRFLRLLHELESWVGIIMSPVGSSTRLEDASGPGEAEDPRRD